MRLVTFSDFADTTKIPVGKARVGALVNDDSAIVDLTSLHANRSEFASMLELIRGGTATLNQARDAVATARASNKHLIARSAATLLTPLPNPPLMKDWGTMSEHAMFFVRRAARARVAREPDPEAAYQQLEAEGQIALPKNYFTMPRFYTANPLNLMGPDAVLTWPSFSNELDYELELGLVIGKTGKDITQERARDFMFGLTLFNDFTARDTQAQENSAAGKSKEFDGSYAIGPCIVTLDEFKDIYDITVRSRINGEQQTESSTKTMKISFEQLIAHTSQSTTIHAGEIYATGTFERGCGTETGRLLRADDVVELEAQGIGTLRNTIRR